MLKLNMSIVAAMFTAYCIGRLVVQSTNRTISKYVYCVHCRNTKHTAQGTECPHCW